MEKLQERALRFVYNEYKLLLWSACPHFILEQIEICPLTRIQQLTVCHLLSSLT